MNNTLQNNLIPASANYVYQGRGTPVILIHGLAASLHDWDDLIPELTLNGYSAYAPDLLGHGDSPKLDSRAYQMDWIFEHFFNWMESLQLTEPAILIGHSLGGHIALEYARRVSARTRGLILVNPFYSRSQLPALLRNTYDHPNLSGLVVGQTPEWLFRFFVDVSSFAIGHGAGALHALPEKSRVQTVLDYKRTAPGVYHIPKVISDMTARLPEINTPALVVWGDRDKTLAPSSFSHLVSALPKARGEILHAGHVPHQSHAGIFNQIVMRFLKELK
ncbi:MAG TPA: alpha/beta hydrolase [Anaerolineales bacterium]|nr:alpha/beta hydrolase [Anaerolineales bacterium]